MPPAPLPIYHHQPRNSINGKRSSSSSSSSTSASANQTAAVADLGNALLASFLVPFAPSLLDRRLNAGFFHDSDTPYWWALTLLAFWGGQHIACWVRRKPGSWHWYMSRLPLRRATQQQLVCLTVVLLAVLSTGWATRVELLLICRWLTGFASVYLWGHAMERKDERFNRGRGWGGGGGGGGMQAATGGGGRWSNNRIVVPSSSSIPITLVSPLVTPMQALGWVLGGLVGGLTFSYRMFVVVGGFPAMVPSIVTAVLVFLLACLVLRRMRKEVDGVGARKYHKPEQLQQQGQSEEQPQLLQLGKEGSGRDALTRAGILLPSPGTAARRNNNYYNNHNNYYYYYYYHPPSTSSRPSSLPPPSPPLTFLQAAGGDYTKARAHYHMHLRWRAEETVEGILSRPHPSFDAIKRYYPHFVHGRGRQGEIVVYEFPGRMGLRELKEQGVGAEEIGRHYVYFNEFLSRKLSGKGRRGEALEGRKEGGGNEDEVRVMTVLDIGGLGLGTLSKDLLEVLRTTSHLLHRHYPSRVVRIVVVNAPFFVGGAWKVLSSVLPRQVQDTIELSSHPEVDLLKYIDWENIPKEYGGGSSVGLGESEEEGWLRKLVGEGARTGWREGAGTEEKGEVETPPWSSSSIVKPLPSSRTTSLPSSIVTTSTTTTISSSSSSSNRWLPSFLPLRKGPSPKHAHLGIDNKFVFDKARGVWVLREEEAGEEEGEEDDMAHLLPGENEGREREEKEEEEEEEEENVFPSPETEEDGLVLAIQAAHYAELLAREGKKSPPSFPSSYSSSPSAALVPRALWHHSGHQQQAAWRENATTTNTATATAAAAAAAAAIGSAGLKPSLGAHASADLGRGSSSPSFSSCSSFSTKPSSPLLFLQTTLLFFLLSLLQNSLLPMLPIWLAIPHSIGGLSLPPSLLGLLLSFGATVTFVAHAYALPPSLLRLPTSNPLQAFRLAVFVFVSCTVLLSGLHPHVTSLPSTSSSHSLSSASIIVGFEHCVAFFLYLLLLVVVVSSLFFARAASTTLLHLISLPPSLSPLLSFILSCTEVVGPVVGAWVLSWSVAAAGVGVTYPMDARLIWHVSALVLVGLYVMTLQLQVVLKGDWGAMRLEEGGGGGGGRGFVFLGKGGKKKGRKKNGRRSSGPVGLGV